MTPRDSRAGGFLLMLAIIIGLAAGIALGNPAGGAFIGALAGIGLAVAVWLIDRRRT